jgi:hypothetical protein
LRRERRKKSREKTHKKIKNSKTKPLPLPGADLTAEEADALRAHVAAFPGATALVRGAWLLACAEAGKLLPMSDEDDGDGDGNVGGEKAKASNKTPKAQQQQQQKQKWALSLPDLAVLVRSASAAAVTNAAAAAAVAAVAAAATGDKSRSKSNNASNANAANGEGEAAAAAAAAAATAAVEALPLAGLHFTLAAMCNTNNINGNSNSLNGINSNSENAAEMAALRTELAKAGARTFDSRTTSGVPRDAAYALCPPGLSPEAAGVLERRADW